MRWKVDGMWFGEVMRGGAVLRWSEYGGVKCSAAPLLLDYKYLQIDVSFCETGIGNLKG